MFLVVGTWVLAWATSWPSVTSEEVDLGKVQTKKCANIDDQLETCIAYGLFVCFFVCLFVCLFICLFSISTECFPNSRHYYSIRIFAVICQVDFA